MFYEGRGGLQEGSRATVTDRHSRAPEREHITDHRAFSDLQINCFFPKQGRELLDLLLGLVCFYKATFQSILKLCILVIHLFWIRALWGWRRAISNVLIHRIHLRNTFPIMIYDTAWFVVPLGRIAFSPQRTSPKSAFSRAEAAFTLAQKKTDFFAHIWHR